MNEMNADMSSQLSNPVTIDDIAKRAKVHPSTVSRTMAADPEKLTPRRRKILEMAKEMGYTPNVNAAALRRGASDTIGSSESSMCCSSASDTMCWSGASVTM